MIIDRCSFTANPLAGRVAVVTGAGQGIGRETARVLARLGAAVVIAEIQPTGAETEKMIRDSGGRALFVQTDLADRDSIDRLCNETRRAFGAPDIVINNAAAYTTKPLLDVSVAEWDRVMAVNLRGAFLLAKAFLPEMLEKQQGVFITMQSAEGMPYLAPYLATKVGLRSLTASLAQEIGDGRGVAVYCFGPGVVATPGALGAFDDLAVRYGLSDRAEFVAQTGVPLMSAELAATGLVGTILHAADFHGQDCFTSHGLSLLGLDADGEPLISAPPDLASAEAIAATTDADTDRWSHLVALSRRTEDVLRDNVREYAELSPFQRPVVKRMFQHGTGLRVEDWLAQAEAMTKRLGAAAQAGQDPIEVIGAAQVKEYVAQLRRMADYIRKQETDARGWIKDQAKLAVALAALRERQAVFAELAEELARELA